MTDRIATSETQSIDGTLNAENAANHIGEILDELNLEDDQFVVTLSILGAAKTLPTGEPIPEDGFALVASIAQLGGDGESRNDNLIRAFGQMGVELLTRGFEYPALLGMVESADKAINEGRNGSIQMIDANEAIKSLMEALSLAGEDDESIPQA